jgi:Zn-dependent M16 (insulinase) family peptidase
MLESGSPAPFSARSAATPAGIFDLVGRDWIIYRLKALDEKIGPSLDLARSLITQADFSDQRLVRDLVLEMKNEADSSLAPGGHSYASSRSACLFSRSRAVDEIWNGLTQIEFAHQLVQMDTSEIISKLTAIRDTLSINAGLIINLTGSASALKTSRDLAEKEFGSFGPPRPRNPASVSGTPFFEQLNVLPGADAGHKTNAASEKKAVVYASPSLQVGFAALSLAASPYDTPEQTAELVLSHQLSTGALWEDIRMKGGAYGAFANPDSLEGVFSFATYRDPNPLRSLEAFSSILKNGTKNTQADSLRREDELTKVIIGCYARETRPRTAAEKGFSDFLRFLYGIEDICRQRKLERLINLSADQIDGALRGLASQNISSPVIIAGTKTAEKAAKTLGAELRRLPV